MAEAGLSSREVARAFIAACEDELAAPKPGNVHLFAPGHGMEARHFIESAQAAAGPLCAPDASVGERIFGAIEATWERVGLNTNLGIVLLCAPLAHAALQREGADLRERTADVLKALDRSDASLAFRAILRAKPAGLGAAKAHDVTQEPLAGLTEAMRAAAHRDRVAFQYANDFEDIFGLGSAALQTARARGCEKDLATLHVFMTFLSHFPDSHILRKFGEETAVSVMREAREVFARLQAADDREGAFSFAMQYDEALKTRAVGGGTKGVNPGTSADLTVATLFANYLSGILPNLNKNG